MLDEAKELAPLETGGMLLGYVVADRGSVEVVVERIIGPGPEALHGRTRFLPDGPWQRQELARIFNATGGTTTYLGDWHSHPGGGRAPSALDLKTARAIARSRRARTPHPLMAIVHSGQGAWGLAVHRYAERALDALVAREFEG